MTIMLKLTVLPAQILAVAVALDTYARLGESKLDVVAQMVSHGVVPMRSIDRQGRQVAPAETSEAFQALMTEAVGALTVGEGDIVIAHRGKERMQVARQLHGRISALAQAGAPNGLSAESVPLVLTLDDARVLSEGCEAFSRLGMCQLSFIAEMVSVGEIPVWHSASIREFEATMTATDEMRHILDRAQGLMGFTLSSSHGIGNPHLDVNVQRAWEVRKVIEKALAYHRDPTPSFKGVNYDGLICRYTTDRAPEAAIVTA